MPASPPPAADPGSPAQSWPQPSPRKTEPVPGTPLGSWLADLSGSGLLLGTLFFAASLTPTLIPRSALTQGLLAGTCMAAGVGLGLVGRALWRYLELPQPLHTRTRLRINQVLLLFCAGALALVLAQAAHWQNTIRAVMALPPVASVHPVKVCGLALLAFAAWWLLARLFRLVARATATWARQRLPRRLANVLGVLAALVLFWLVANKLLLGGVLQLADASFREYDARLEAERPRPEQPGQTGGPGSLIDWQQLGRAGREFIAATPQANDIAARTGKPARQPIRVYVGLPAADDAARRAQLALAELQRVGAFERPVLVVVTPTGTGWVDPAAMAALENLLHGDVASVAMQYSYLSSPLSLLVQPEYGEESARALFGAIYAYWRQLPPEHRPRLYLHGLSLGAMNSERSADLFELIGEPIGGAVWSGPPFPSRIWRAVTARRAQGSPSWRPVFRDSALIRFTNQQGLDPAAIERSWGPMRVVYLQYASDPVTFFDYRDLFRPPAWISTPRGPDVSPALRWYPVVSMLQLALDMAMATDVPMGYGHVYAPSDYVTAWQTVLAPTNWSALALAQLQRQLDAEAFQAMQHLPAEPSPATDPEGYQQRGG